MKAGASKIDITPPVGVWLEGIPRNKPSDRVLDPLYARTVYLTNDKTELVIMVCDLVGLSEDDLEPIKKQISRETGISPHNTVIAFTHTHSGPATLGLLTPKEMEYIDGLKYKLASVVKEAREQAVPCKVKVAYSYETMISEYRRLMDKNGKIWMNWEEFNQEDIVGPAGPDDPEVGVICLADLDGGIIATLFNHTGHPNTLTGFDYSITPDYPGDACRRVEEKLGGTAVFFNGAQGSSDIPGFNDRNPQGVKKRGKILADAVLEALEDENSEFSFSQKLDIIYAKLAIPKRSVPPEKVEEARQVLKASQTAQDDKSLRDGVDEDIYARWLIEMIDDGKTSYLMPFNGIRIADAFIFTEPAELFTEIGLKIKKYSPFVFTFIIGLADGYFGYIPTEKAIEEGGYATRAGIASRLDKKADSMIIDLAMQLASELQ